MSVAGLRYLNETFGILSENCNPDLLKLDQLRELSLNEAYFGKDVMKDIQEAMNECIKTINIDRMIDITNYPCNKKLEKACEEAFGFKRVHIIWNDSVMFNSNFCTITGSRIVPYTKDAALRLFGKKTIVESPIGYYNKQHDLVVYICMDSNIVSSKNLTNEEVVAILLHEIGHNFDYTFASFLTQFTQIFASLNDIFTNKENPGKIANAIKNTVLYNITPVKGIIAWITHIDTWLTSKIPAYGELIRMCGNLISKINSLMVVVFLPGALIKSAASFIVSPGLFLNASIIGLNNIFVRHGEFYADSFAASYGYGPQLITALEKLMDMTSDLRTDVPVLNTFWSLAEIEQELMSSLYIPICTGNDQQQNLSVQGDHGSNQQRLKSLMNKLQNELKDTHITPEMKKDIKRELDEMYTIYNETIMKPNSKALYYFRKFMDAYMNGKDKVPLLNKIVQANRA